MEISVRLGLRLTAKSAGLLSGVYRRAVANFSVTQMVMGPAGKSPLRLSGARWHLTASLESSRFAACPKPTDHTCSRAAAPWATFGFGRARATGWQQWSRWAPRAQRGPSSPERRGNQCVFGTVDEKRLSCKSWTGNATASRSFQPEIWIPTRPRLPA
jgi:hypothetical protein